MLRVLVVVSCLVFCLICCLMLFGWGLIAYVDIVVFVVVFAMFCLGRFWGCFVDLRFVLVVWDLLLLRFVAG